MFEIYLQLNENDISGKMTKNIWMLIGLLSGCALLISIYRAAVIGTSQGIYIPSGWRDNEPTA